MTFFVRVLTLWFCVEFLSVGSWRDTLAPGRFENLLVVELQKRVRDFMLRGSVDHRWRTPPMDPLRLPDQTIDWNTDHSHVHLLMSHLELKGLADFAIRRLKWDHQRGELILEVVLPRITFDGEYDVRGHVSAVLDAVNSVDVEEHGSLLVSHRNVVVTCNAVLVDDYLQHKTLHDFHMDINVGNVVSRIQSRDSYGWLGPMLSAVLTQNGRHLFESMKQRLMPVLTRALWHKIDQMLRNFDAGYSFPSYNDPRYNYQLLPSNFRPRQLATTSFHYTPYHVPRYNY